MLVNGAAAKGISVLFYPRETGKSVAEKIIGETGIKPERLTAFKPNDAAALTQPQQALLTGIDTFRQPQFDVLLARAPGLKVYMIEKAVELEQVLIGGVDAQKEGPQPEDASGRSEPIASAPEPQPVRPPEPPAIVKEAVTEAPETTPAPTPAENVPQPDLAKTIANLRERAHQTSQGCGRFFGWLSKYHLEYGVNPAAVQDFKSQIDLLKDSKIPEFIKLFLPQQSTGYFGKPYDQVTSKAIGSRMTEARICVNTLFSSDNKVLESYADLISYIGTRSKRVPWSKIHEQAISSIQHAYDQRSNLLSEVRNPLETTDGTTLTKWRKEGNRIAANLWPSDAEKFRLELSTALTEASELAGRNDAKRLEARKRMADVAARRREADQIAAAERFREQQVLGAQNCVRMFSHPDDPDLPEGISGRPDSELTNIDGPLLKGCEAEVKLNPDDPMAEFLLGRALLFSGDAEKAVAHLLTAAEGGNAPAFAYLAEFDDDLESARSLLRVSIDLGFEPAIEQLAALDAHAAALERYHQQVEDAKEAARQAVEETERLRNAALLPCDKLALHPDAPGNLEVPGVLDENIDVEAAIIACTRAVQADPTNGRPRFQLARALFLADGLQDEAVSQFRIASAHGYGLASFALFQILDDQAEAFEFLKKAAGGGVLEAVSLLSKMPNPRVSLTMDMVYQDSDQLESRHSSLKFTDYIDFHSTQSCFDQINVYGDHGLAVGINILRQIQTGREMDYDFWSDVQRMTTQERLNMVRGICENITKTYGDCIDTYLVMVNGEIFDLLDPVTHNTIVIANSDQARRNPEFLDSYVGELTDYVGYLYARRLGLLTLESVEFDDHYMFTNQTDEFAIEVVREIVKSDKLYVVTQATENKLLCH